MAGRRQLPDIMGEALGRLRLATSEAPSNVVPLAITMAEPQSSPELISKMARMRLMGMAQALEEQTQAPSCALLSFEERLGQILDREMVERRQRRLARALKKAGLRYQPDLEDMDWSQERGFQRRRLEELAQGEWVAERRNLLISGPVGVGKTFVACLLAKAVCQSGGSALYARASQLAAELAQARRLENHAKVLASLVKPKLLVIDDWGLEALPNREGLEIFELLEARYQKGSLLVVSPLPLDDWGKAVADPTLAAATVDRLRERSLSLAMQGRSRRGEASPWG